MKMTLDQIQRHNRIQKQQRIQAQLRAQTEAIENTYAPNHIFAGVTMNDPADRDAYTGPSYVSIAFSDLIKSPTWKQARKTFAGLLLNGHTIESARMATVTTHGI